MPWLSSFRIADECSGVRSARLLHGLTGEVVDLTPSDFMGKKFGWIQHQFNPEMEGSLWSPSPETHSFRIGVLNAVIGRTGSCNPTTRSGRGRSTSRASASSSGPSRPLSRRFPRLQLPGFCLQNHFLCFQHPFHIQQLKRAARCFPQLTASSTAFPTKRTFRLLLTPHKKKYAHTIALCDILDLVFFA